MAITGNADVFVPQVIGDVASDILWTKVPLLRSGVVRNMGNAVWSEGGNTVTFPYFDTTLAGQVQDVSGDALTRTGVTPTKIHMGTYPETVESKIISLDFEKYIFNDASKKMDINQHVGEVVAKESAKSIQALLFARAEATDLTFDATAEVTKTLTVDNILEAKNKRGEYAEDGDPVLFVHSKCFKDLAKTSDFKTLSTAATLSIVRAMGNVPNGAIAYIHGCWIVKMDSVSLAATVYTNLMVWPGGLGFLPKQEIETKRVQHAGSIIETADFDFRYAGTLVRMNPRGVVRLKTN